MRLIAMKLIQRRSGEKRWQYRSRNGSAATMRTSGLLAMGDVTRIRHVARGRIGAGQHDPRIQEPSADQSLGVKLSSGGAGKSRSPPPFAARIAIAGWTPGCSPAGLRK
jgi:hypothetical protein